LGLKTKSLSELGFTGLKDLQDFVMRRKNPDRDYMPVENLQWGLQTISKNGARPAKP
jgi:hypothetical protein